MVIHAPLLARSGPSWGLQRANTVHRVVIHRKRVCFSCLTVILASGKPSLRLKLAICGLLLTICVQKVAAFGLHFFTSRRSTSAKRSRRHGAKRAWWGGAGGDAPGRRAQCSPDAFRSPGVRRSTGKKERVPQPETGAWSAGRTCPSDEVGRGSGNRSGEVVGSLPRGIIHSVRGDTAGDCSQRRNSRSRPSERSAATTMQLWPRALKQGL